MLPGHRAQFLLSVRVPHHVAAALAARGRTGRNRWLLAGAASVAVDLAIGWLCWTDDQLRRRRGLRVLVDLADSAVWSLASASSAAPEAVRYHAIATIVPGTVEEGLRLSSGMSADPNASGSAPGRRDVAGVASAILGPTVVTRLVRRRHGLRSSALEDLGWGALALAGGLALARVRERQYREARREAFDVLEGMQVAATHALTAVAANRQTSGHEFKSVLNTLGELLRMVGDVEGAATARAELQRCQDEEAEAFERARQTIGGTLLADAARRAGVGVEPVEDGCIWLPGDEVDRLVAFVARVDDEAAEQAGKAGEDVTFPVLRVVEAGWDRALVEVHGRQERFGADEPRPTASLDITRVGLVLSAIWKVLTMPGQMGGVPPAFALPAVLVDLDNLRHHLEDGHQRGSDEPPPGRFWAESIAAMLVCILPALRRTTPERTAEGWPLNPGAEQGTLLLLGHYWHHLTPRQRRTLGGIVTATWLAKAARPERRDSRAIWELVAEVMNPLSLMLATANLDRRIDVESHDLEARLLSDVRAEINAVRVSALSDLAETYRRQLAVAEQLRRRLASRMSSGEDLSDAVLALRQRIKHFGRWIDDLVEDDGDAPEGRVWEPS